MKKEIKLKNCIGLICLAIFLTFLFMWCYYEYRYDLNLGEKACESWGYECYQGTAYHWKQDDNKFYPEGFICKDENSIFGKGHSIIIDGVENEEGYVLT